MKNLFFYLLILTVNNSYSQSYLKKYLDNYENVIIGTIIDTKTIEDDCILKKRATVSITKIISGDRFQTTKEIKIPYSTLSLNCLSGSFTGTSYYKNDTYLFFFNNEDTLVWGNYASFKIKKTNSEKYQSLINNYRTLNSSDSSEVIDWIIKYANLIRLQDDPYREFFQARLKLGKYYIPLKTIEGNCNCKNSYSLNDNQKKNLRLLYLENNKYTIYDSCILQTLGLGNDDKEVYFSAIKKLYDCYSKEKCFCEKSLINEIAKLSDDYEIKNLSEKMMIINTSDEKFEMSFELLIKKLIKNTPNTIYSK